VHETDHYPQDEGCVEHDSDSRSLLWRPSHKEFWYYRRSSGCSGYPISFDDVRRRRREEVGYARSFHSLLGGTQVDILSFCRLVKHILTDYSRLLHAIRQTHSIAPPYSHKPQRESVDARKSTPLMGGTNSSAKAYFRQKRFEGSPGSVCTSEGRKWHWTVVAHHLFDDGKIT